MIGWASQPNLLITQFAVFNYRYPQSLKILTSALSMVPVTNIRYDPKFGLVVGVITALYGLTTQRKAKTNFQFFG